MNGGGDAAYADVSSISNLRLTGPSGLGRIALGDIERRVANVRRVGDGDRPYGSRMGVRLRTERSVC